MAVFEIKKNKEYKTNIPGVGLILRAAPATADKMRLDKANNFYIVDVITHDTSVNGSASYIREMKTMDRNELRELLDLPKKASIKVI